MRQEIYVCDICGSEICKEEYAEYYQGSQNGWRILNDSVLLMPVTGKHICDKCYNKMNEALVRAMLAKQEDNP
mgnify:CR=1 FL=1